MSVPLTQSASFMIELLAKGLGLIDVSSLAVGVLGRWMGLK